MTDALLKPWHGSQYPVNRKIDKSNRFGAECLYAVSFSGGNNGDAWEAVNGIYISKGGDSDSPLATGPLGIGMDCGADAGDAVRNHYYAIPAGFTYDAGATEDFVVCLYGTAEDGNFLNFIGDASASASTMRFRSTGDNFYMQWAGGGARSLTLTSGLTGPGSGVHLYTIIVDQTNSRTAIYVDGVLDVTNTTAAEGFDFHHFLAGINTTGYGWDGYIQEIQVFLTPSAPWGDADAAAHAENFFQIYETDNIIPYLSPHVAAAGGSSSLIYRANPMRTHITR